PGEVFRASRPTIVPGVAPGSSERSNAAAPATNAADALVPVIATTDPSGPSADTSTPGAEMNAALLEFEPLHRSSFRSVAATPTTNTAMVSEPLSVAVP